MAKICIQHYKTGLAELVLGSIDGSLCLCDYRHRRLRQQVDNRLQRYSGAEYVWQDTPVLGQARQQLDDYLAGKRQSFDLPLTLIGTPFQQQVWQALQQIPYGSTASYQDIGQRIGNPNAVRAVGTANGANALAIIIPCHRIIGRQGALVGYGGGLAIKKQLLALEQPNFALIP